MNVSPEIGRYLYQKKAKLKNWEVPIGKKLVSVERWTTLVEKCIYAFYGVTRLK